MPRKSKTKKEDESMHVPGDLLLRLNIHRGEIVRYAKESEICQLRKQLFGKDSDIAAANQKVAQIESDFHQYRKKVQEKELSNLGDEIQKALGIEDLSKYNIDYLTGYVGSKE